MSSKKVYIITATTGTEFLDTCVASVQKQDYKDLEHVLVCDGVEHIEKVKQVLDRYKDSPIPISLVVLPWNTGRDRFICHKIYAAIPHLLHGSVYVSFLDEDNYVEPNHISAMMETIETKKCFWAFCLRNIVGKKNNLICRDICESLGNLSMTWVSEYHKVDFLVDTSCYLVPVDILRQFSECWQRKARSVPEADRLFYKELSSKYRNFECSMKYTLNYRVDGRPDSVKADFFMMGNSKMRTKYHDNVPWDV